MSRGMKAKWFGGVMSLAMVAALPAAAFAAAPQTQPADPACGHLQAALQIAPHLGGYPDVQARAATCGIQLQYTSGEPQCDHLLAALQVAPDLRAYPGVRARIVACSGPGEAGLPDQFFDDLSGYGWAQAQIDALAKQGIFKGEDARHFNPKGHLTRVEFAALMARLFHLPQPAQPETFVDVLPGFWGYSDVEAAAPYMTTFQVPSGTAFEPELDETRIEVAATIGRIEIGENAAQLPSAGQAQALWGQFNDGAQVPAGLSQYAAVALQLGLMEGYPDGSFGVDHPLTRAEAAVLLDRVLNSSQTIGGSTAGTSGTGGTGGATTTTSGYVVGDQANSVVVGVYGASGMSVSTYLLTPTTSVTVNGQAASAGSLPAGDAVTVTLNASSQPTAVAATSPAGAVIQGAFQGAAGGAATVMVNGTAQAVPIGAAPVVLDHEQTVGLTSLPTGTSVTIDEGVINGSALIISGA